MPKSHTATTRSWKARRDERKAEATERNAAYEKLSLRGRVAALDKRLGDGQGATRQRYRLAYHIKKVEST